MTPVVRDLVVADLVRQASPAQPGAVARLLSLVEQQSEQGAEAVALLTVRPTLAPVVGITGSPGVGKSTLTSALITAYRALGRTVAVLAVDPTSPVSGGALLGDRIRMTEHAVDGGVFIRSMATRGHLGGLSVVAPKAIGVLASVGYDVVLVETVGVGQNEVEVARDADTTIVVLAPGMGDGIQAAKAGILEIADIFVVNKADRPGVHATLRELRTMNGTGATGSADGWRTPALATVGTTGEGVAELIAAVDTHWEWLRRNGSLTPQS